MASQITLLVQKGLVKLFANGVKYSVKVVEIKTYADGTEIITEKTKVATEAGYQLT
jgi:hypothetical protein